MIQGIFKFVKEYDVVRSKKNNLKKFKCKLYHNISMMKFPNKRSCNVSKNFSALNIVLFTGKYCHLRTIALNLPYIPTLRECIDLLNGSLTDLQAYYLIL